MLKFLKKRIYNDETGAIDKILVTLLLIIVAVGGVIGLSTWTANNEDMLEKQALAEIEAILEKDVPAAGDPDDPGNHFGQFK